MKTNNSETGRKLQGAAESGSDAPTCSPSSDTPETSRIDSEKFTRPFERTYFTAYQTMMNHAENLERALRASLTYEAARAESIRYACFDDTPERLVGQPHAWIETVLQVAEEEAGENFRKLRDAALGIAENELL
jgi:hypothetical protein